jgi:hypothetical protein
LLLFRDLFFLLSFSFSVSFFLLLSVSSLEPSSPLSSSFLYFFFLSFNLLFFSVSFSSLLFSELLLLLLFMLSFILSFEVNLSFNNCKLAAPFIKSFLMLLSSS